MSGVSGFFLSVTTDPCWTRSGYVALKINVSSITGKNNETRILRWLKDSTHNQSGYQNTMHLLDDFVLEGPNGSHECLVTEVVGSMNEFKFSSGFGAHTKEISFQMLNGLAYLHSQGVAHGGMDFPNIPSQPKKIKSIRVKPRVFAEAR